jgi:hypothetical protein
MLASVALLAAGVAGSALAQSASLAQGQLENALVLNVGAFVFQTEVKARVNGQAVFNPDVDFDQTFGRAKDANRIRADVLWRITPTHHARLLYFNNSQSRSRALANDVKWGDFTFEKDSNVSADTKYSITELAYEYAFMRQPGHEVAATIGVHYTEISLKLSGAAAITDPNGVTTRLAFTSKEASAPAPLPVIGLRAGWVVAPSWYVDAQGQYFKVKVGGVDGSVSDVRVGATWMFSRHLGIGLGYNRFITTVNVAKDSFDGRLRFGYSGLQTYLSGTY